MMESYPDNVLKDLDARSSAKQSWSRQAFPQKPFKKRPYPIKTVEGLDEDEEDDDDDDAYASATTMRMKTMAMKAMSMTTMKKMKTKWHLLMKKDGCTLVKTPSMPLVKCWLMMMMNTLPF